MLIYRRGHIFRIRNSYINILEIPTQGMLFRSGFILLYASMLLLFASCRKMHEPDSRAFYYWKTDFRLSAPEKDLIKKTGVTSLYIRFFDVDWDANGNAPTPVAPVTFSELPDTSLNIIPVVYITNKTLLNSRLEDMPNLANKIMRQVDYLAQNKISRFNELQMDCDWTEATKGKYFSLLTTIAGMLHPQHKIISATIRLHQVKYPEKTGVPPVDRGMLMFYNMGKITAEPGRNSIYNAVDADKYTASIEKYALPLDAALPIFGWVIHIREGKVKGVLNKNFIPDLSDNPGFSNNGNDSFTANASFFLHGEYFMKNDKLRIERMTPDVTSAAALKAARNLKYEQRTVALFDIDSTAMVMFHEKECNEIFARFK